MLNVYWGQGDIFGRIKMRDNLGNEIIGNICRSNAFFTTCVAYYEKGVLYRQPWYFFVDLGHLKRCLGIGKGNECILNDQFLEIRLNHSAPKEIKEACQLIAKTLEISLMWFDDLDEYRIDEVDD